MYYAFLNVLEHFCRPVDRRILIMLNTSLQSNAALLIINTLCLKKNDNDVLRYNFNAHQPILIIFARYIAE